jgi:hypothetical protein
MSQQVHNARLLHIDPTNWLRVMLEFEYPIILQFHGDHTHVVQLFHERFPNAPIPEIGPAALCSDPFFDNQDAWNEMELCNQSSLFRLTEDRDFIINGLGLPFERLYFQARAQLSYATDELLHIRRRAAVDSFEEFQVRRAGRQRSSP